jgi:hypothetical protein
LRKPGASIVAESGISAKKLRSRRERVFATDLPMLIGYAYTYAKTSTGDQELSRQRAALAAAGCTLIYEDRLTMGDPRPERKRALDQLSEGNTLIVTQLDRLEMPIGGHELTRIAGLLNERQAGLRSLSEAWADATCMVTSTLDYEKFKKDPIALKPIYDKFVRTVLESENDFKVDYPYCLTFGHKKHSKVERWGVLIYNLLEIFLKIQNQNNFDYDYSQKFCEKLRRIGRWFELESELEKWFKRTLYEPFMAPIPVPIVYPIPPRRLKDNADTSKINSKLIQFSCYIAVCIMKYGASYNYLSANEIFDVVTLLGSNLPSQLRKHGSGELPRAITDYKDDEVTFKANDAFATIRISVRNEREENYHKVLDHLVRVLESEFPRSYAIEFSSPNKAFLPIRGLPKKGVNQLFANAAIYPALRPLIERYARLAMREFEWYSNTPEENPAMPGTFAVFALTSVDDAYGGLALDYLRICDGEHQSVHANLVHAYIAKHGFTGDAIRLLIASAENIQNMTAHKTYPALIANRDSLEFLAQARKAQQSETLASELKENTLWARDPDRAWQNVLIAIWGDTAINRPEKIAEAAPEGLRSLYRSILRLDENTAANNDWT